MRRVARLGAHILSRPLDLAPYLHQSLLNGETYRIWKNKEVSFLPRRSTLDLELPWLSYSAISRLRERLKPGTKVFEWGSGGSTLFMARQGANVTSIEHHPEWFEMVRLAIEQRGLANTLLRNVPIDSWEPNDFSAGAFANAMLEGERYDVIFIDLEDPPPYALRPICLTKAVSHVKPGGLIVVDDSWRYREAVDAVQCKGRDYVAGVGPCRPGVTETAFLQF